MSDCSWNVEGNMLSITNLGKDPVPSGALAILYGVKVISSTGSKSPITAC